MKIRTIAAVLILPVISIAALCVPYGCLGKQETADDPANALYRDASLPVEDRVSDLLSRMTLNEKCGQMALVERMFLKQDDHIREYGIGGILSGGGSAPHPNTPGSWIGMIDSFQAMALSTRLAVPIIYGSDAVHGNNNLAGAVIFPHNIGLGATRDPKLVEDIGRITAIEMTGAGMHWNFAPCLAVPQNERWGRTYEGYSEYAPLVSELGIAYIRGLQGPLNVNEPVSVIASAKHYLGDGGTLNGKDRGNTIATEEKIREVYLAPYKAAVKAGTKSVMVSFSSLNGKQMHAHRRFITDILKGELGFEGFVVSDWGGIDFIAPRYRDCVRESVLAGIDMVMIPDKYEEFLLTLKALVTEGDIPMERIDDAVSRILRVKFSSGIFETPYAEKSTARLIGCEEHRIKAREAVSKSLVVLKNRNNILPLSKKIKSIFVAGKSADSIGNQCGGWTLTWQGLSDTTIPGTSILEAIRNAVSPATRVSYSENGTGGKGHDVAVVVIGELPYAEMYGDKENINLSVVDADAVDNCRKEGLPVVVILVSGRPMIVTDYIAGWDAFIAAWLPGTEGAGVADILFGNVKPSGKLPYSWPKNSAQLPVNYGDEVYEPLFPFGFGLTFQ
ncbi:MAG: glycoside hydrolase family 3 C-terminal domain-containing protein [Spirochaetales bacterium]|nr:glycoside hydrolase family 3 C-terminal domain-containing protein [Spirochaetales bacterium]